jgi:hypothetical protein
MQVADPLNSLDLWERVVSLFSVRGSHPKPQVYGGPIRLVLRVQFRGRRVGCQDRWVGGAAPDGKEGEVSAGRRIGGEAGGIDTLAAEKSGECLGGPSQRPAVHGGHTGAVGFGGTRLDLAAVRSLAL